MVDQEGRTFIDFLAGCASLNYGHNDPDLSESLIKYVSSTGLVHGLDLVTTAKQNFLEVFADSILAPRDLDYKVQFSGPTGSNAVEAALKLARKVTGRSEVIAFTNGFHGVTAGALAATGNQHHRMGSSVPLPGIQRALFDNYLGPDVDTADLLEKLLDDPSSGYDQPAAIVLETVQGEGGLNTASAAWLRKVAAIAKKHGALLIVDDIQAGCGRTGTFFSFEGTGIVPDIVTLSKSLSGFGLPLAVVLIKPEYDQWKPGEHNGTFRGNNLGFVTAAAALTKYWGVDDLSLDIARRSSQLRRGLDGISSLVPGSKVKGKGMMIGLDVGSGETARSVCSAAFQRGLIIETSGPSDEVVKLLPPLTTPDDLVESGVDILHDAVADVVDSERSDLVGVGVELSTRVT